MKIMVRNHLYIKHISMIIAVLGHLGQVEAQISQGGSPYSFSGLVSDSIDTRTMAALDVTALVAEDELEATRSRPAPPRFGYAFTVSWGLDSADAEGRAAQWKPTLAPARPMPESTLVPRLA